MIELEDSEQLIFVIDTDSYAGNFERELCAYMTGCVGECGVGDDMRTIFETEVGDPDELFEFIVSEPDEHGCSRPVTIYPNPRWFNDGNGNHYREGEKAKELFQNIKWPAYNSVAIFYDENEELGYSQEKLKIMKERALKFFELKNEKSWKDFSNVKIEGFRTIKITTKSNTIEEEKV